jgi:hypothetical protein
MTHTSAARLEKHIVHSEVDELALIEKPKPIFARQPLYEFVLTRAFDCWQVVLRQRKCS